MPDKLPGLGNPLESANFYHSSRLPSVSSSLVVGPAQKGVEDTAETVNKLLQVAKGTSDDLSFLDKKKLIENTNEIQAFLLIIRDKMIAEFKRGYLSSRGVEPKPGVAEAATDNKYMKRLNKLLRAHINRLIAESRLKAAQVKRDAAVHRLEVERLLAESEFLEHVASFIQGPLKLERAEGSMLNSLVNYINKEPKSGIPEIWKSIGIQSFVVEHDWAGAFAKSDALKGEFRLPYELCCFEFVVSGNRVCTLWREVEGVKTFSVAVHITADNRWTSFDLNIVDVDDMWVTSNYKSGGPLKEYEGRFATLLGQQVRAVCISLEAEVAVASDVIREPYRSNLPSRAPRALPEFSYHVVSLARLRRKLSATDEPSTGRHRKLHWCRGHWRHYPDHRTWIKWCLKGDPDLGFVDKHYRL